MDAIDLGFRSFILFLLVFARLVGVFVQAPLFGRPKGIPIPAQVGYALAISLLIFHILPIPNNLPEGAVPLAIMIMGQAAIGLMIGFTSYAVAAGLQFAGELMDIQLGLSVAASFDPSSGGTINLLRQFELYLAFLMWIALRGDHFFLKAVVRSYQIIPATSFTINAHALNKLVSVSAGIFTMALEISAPVLVAIFITQVALGLLNRAAQQFNVFMLSFPLNIMVGISILILSLSPMLFKAVPILYDHLNHDIMDLIMSLRGG